MSSRSSPVTNRSPRTTGEGERGGGAPVALREISMAMVSQPGQVSPVPLDGLGQQYRPAALYRDHRLADVTAQQVPAGTQVPHHALTVWSPGPQRAYSM